MSAIRFTTANCPFCKTGQEFEYYQTVNVTMDPGLKIKAMRGELNQKICSNCGKEINIISGFLYHDMEKKFMINFKTTDEKSDFEDSDVTDQLKASGYVFRIVYSIPDLVEKVLIFDNKLNDKVIASVKQYLLSAIPEMEGYKFNLLFKKVNKGFFSTHLVFAFFTHIDQMMEMKLNTKKLDDNQRANLFNLEVLKNENWLSIDSHYKG